MQAHRNDEGRDRTRAPDDWSAAEDAYFRAHFAALSRPSDLRAGEWTFDDARRVYAFGLTAAHRPANANRSYEDLDAELAEAWAADMGARLGDWRSARPLVRAGYELGARARGAVAPATSLGSEESPDHASFSDPLPEPRDRSLGAAEPERIDVESAARRGKRAD